MGYVTALRDRVGTALVSWSAPWNGGYVTWSTSGSVPVVRLEMHPAVQYEIYSDPDTPWLLRILSPGFTKDDLEALFGVPVKVTSELGDGCWRLVAVTEQVITEGGGEPLAVVPRDD